MYTGPGVLFCQSGWLATKRFAGFTQGEGIGGGREGQVMTSGLLASGDD